VEQKTEACPRTA